MDATHTQKHSIGIVGGGFAGIAVAINLINQTHTPIDITLIDRSKHFAKGIAYGTLEPFHPLNVRAYHMGLLPNEQEGFYNWLKEHPERWRNLHANFQNLEIFPQSYVPRMIYGQYLHDFFSEAHEKAQKKGIHFTIHHSEAQDVKLLPSGLLNIQLSDGSSISVERLVLATGIDPHKHLTFETTHLLHDPRYIANAWDPPRNSILHSAPNTPKDILVIGTGLTMADIVTSLVKKGVHGQIYAISPSGYLSESHAQEMPVKIPQHKLTENSSSMRKFMQQFRKELASIKDWRLLIDAIRPAIPKIWQGWTLFEKKQFLRHVFSLWNKHRHRMAPDSAALLSRLVQEKTLQLISGRIMEIDTRDPHVLHIHMQNRNGTSKTINVHYAINCCGPEFSLSKQRNPLLQNLLKGDLIRPDALNLGVALSPEGWAQGKASKKIYALGALLFGERFETTAVPEIRQQAADLAQKLLQN